MSNGPIYLWEIIYQAKTQPVPAKEDIPTYKWFNWLSEPVRIRVSLHPDSQQFLAQQLGFTPVSIPWIYPWATPTLRKSFPIPHQSFTPPQTTPAVTWNDQTNWPDFAPGRPRVLNFDALAFVPDIDRYLLITDQTNWPDFAQGKPRLPLHQPWSFVPAPAQVFFPYAPWDDFTRRKPQPLDTQPLDWPLTPVATPFPAMGWNNWPDFAARQKPTASFVPWTFIPTPAQVFFPYAPWDDFTRRRPQPLDTRPSALVPVVVQAAQQVWYPPNTWPDFAPKARPAIDINWQAFVSTQPDVTVIGDWPDFVRRKPPPIDTQPLSWAAQTIAVQQVWFPYDPWPSLIAKKPAPLNFAPATPFIQTPAQVFFPYGPWGDFARRKPQPLDTQPLAWNSIQFVITAVTTGDQSSTNLIFPWRLIYRTKTEPVFVPPPAQVFFPYGPWDDFARRKPSPLIYPPLTFVPKHIPPLGYIQWPDFATKKRPPLNYIPLTFVQTIRTPWNELSRWPEMVPIRSKAGLHAALQQFSARFPGTITQATITGILNAFEVNSDIASITIVVRQSGPAVRAAVSIQEIGTI